MYFCSDIKWWPRSLCICWSSGSVYSVQERRVCVYGDQDGQYTVTIQPCLLLLPPLWPTGPPPPQHFLLPRALTSQLLLQTITAQLQASPPQTPTGGVSPPSAHSRRQRKQGLTSLPMPHPLLISSIFKSPRVSPAGCRHPPNPPLHCTPPPLSPLLNSPISSQYLSPVHKSTKQLRWKNTIKTRERWGREWYKWERCRSWFISRKKVNKAFSEKNYATSMHIWKIWRQACSRRGHFN